MHDVEVLKINDTSDVKIESLLWILPKYKNIKHLEITKCKFPKEQNYKSTLIKTLCKHQTQLKYLNLSSMSLGVGDANHLKTLLEHTTTLETLILYKNKLGVEGARILAQGLANNSSLKHLDLGHNRLRNKGLRALAEGIYGEGSKCKLEVLCLKNNFFTEKGFKSLVSPLLEICAPLSEKVLHLRSLHISGNDVSLFELKHLQRIVENRVFVDSFERIRRNEDNCLFLSEVNTKTLTEDKVLSRLNKNIKNVIVKELKIAKGQKTKKTGPH